ncbi:hypothetical protein QTP86_031826 [Hemibagrus guttatus]|nr:hypothetical protein QTP86_031826 [Hemibagrus guttatus]
MAAATATAMANLPSGIGICTTAPEIFYLPELIFGGLVWILVASTHIQPENPQGWVMFVSVFCFVMTFMWLIIFACGAHKNKGGWATATTTTVPVLKKSTVSCPNDYRPVVLTPIVMKCFKRLVMRHIKTQLPPSLDLLWFVYSPDCETEPAGPEHPPLQLDPGLPGRPQSVRIGNSFFSTTTLSIGAPQGCLLSPLLFTLLTHNCAAMHSSNHIIKFADDMTVMGLISKNDESAYREEVQCLTTWCRANNLSLNIDKTKKMVVDFRRAQSDHSPLSFDRSPVEIVKSTKFPGVHLVENFTSTQLNTSSITEKAQQCLYFLRRLRKAHLPPPILTMFYRGTMESVLSSCITAWFGNCTVSDRKTLQRIVRTAEKIIGRSLPSITDMYTTRCIRKANNIDFVYHFLAALFYLSASVPLATITLSMRNSTVVSSVNRFRFYQIDIAAVVFSYTATLLYFIHCILSAIRWKSF